MLPGIFDVQHHTYIPTPLSAHGVDMSLRIAGAPLSHDDPTVADADIKARCGSGEDSVHVVSNRTGH